jgi:hypothetical protein
MPGFLQQYTRATVIGAYNTTGTPIPKDWAQPTNPAQINAMKIGEQLARQTADPQAVLPALAAEVDRCFPDLPAM